jgi:hypothetical protein
VQLDESLFVGIEVGQTVVIDDPDGAFTVTAFDANHCPGRRSSFSGYNCVCIVLLVNGLCAHLVLWNYRFVSYCRMFCIKNDWLV